MSGSGETMRVLRARDLAALAEPNALIDVAALAAVALAEESVSAPTRLHQHVDDTVWLTMPASGAGLFGAKLVSVAPRNALVGRPVTSGLMLLMDGASGAPLAMVNAAILTAERSGAITGLAIRHLAPQAQCVGIVGAGNQAVAQAIYAATASSAHTISIFARSTPAFERFSEKVRARIGDNVRLKRCENIADLVRSSEVVITATTSELPVIPDIDALLAGKTFISMGSYRPSMQELPLAVYRLAREIIVDSPDAICEVGDLINPLSTGIIERSGVVGLDKLVRGYASATATKAFKSVGHAAYDLYAANFLYSQALVLHIGEDVAL